jgi:hypothetical protein
MSVKSHFGQFAARLRDFIISTSSTSPKTPVQGMFESLALDLFVLQYGNNPAYRRICDSRSASPQSVQHWTQIPAVPTSAFKEFTLSCLPSGNRTSCFFSSGTTQQQPSRHFHNAQSLAIYESSALAWFNAHFCSHHRNSSKLDLQQLAILTPSPAEAPNSSLVYMFEIIRRSIGTKQSSFLGRTGDDNGWTLEFERTLETLKHFAQNEQPAFLLGTAFSFVHLLDFLADHNIRLQLPSASRVLETGGYKGRSREMSRTNLHLLITRHLGIPPDGILCEYGMSELSSQAYSTPSNASRFLFPPWARAQVISPETGREVGETETGLLRVYDLANVYSVMAIQTEDLGIRCRNGFELLGRAVLAEPRGCSLMAV